MMSKLRTNKFTTIYTNPSLDEPELVVENLLTMERYSISDPRLFDILYALTEWTDQEVVLEMIRDHLDISDGADIVLGKLLDRGFLVTTNSESASLDLAAQNWEQFNWRPALWYYLYQRNHPFVDYSTYEAWEEDNRRMEQYADNDPIPPIYKTYDDAQQVSLPSVENSKEITSISEVLNATPWSQPPGQAGSRPVDVDRLSQLLYFTFGETGRIEFEGQGEFLSKTSPSGGARHPTEAYVLALNVNGLPEGVYHYSVKDHALDVIKEGRIEREVEETLYGLNLKTGPNFNTNVVVVFSSVLLRSMWRYREARSYRVILHDIGHLLETMKLTAFSLGHYTYFNHGFNESDIEELLEVDGFQEPTFMYAAVGN